MKTTKKAKKKTVQKMVTMDFHDVVRYDEGDLLDVFDDELFEEYGPSDELLRYTIMDYKLVGASEGQAIIAVTVELEYDD